MWVILLVFLIVIVGLILLIGGSKENPYNREENKEIIINYAEEKREINKIIEKYLTEGGILNLNEYYFNKKLDINVPGDHYVKNISRQFLNFGDSEVSEILKKGEDRWNLTLPDKNYVTIVITYHHIYPEKIIEQERSKNPDVKLLILDGEPANLSNIKLNKDDIIMTTKKDIDLLPISTSEENCIYLPYYLHYMFNEKMISIETLKNSKLNLPNKTKFCAFAYSNCDERFKGVVNRKNFYHLMKKMTNRVDNLGRCYNENPDTTDFLLLSNDQLFRDYKFVIAFENHPIKGYVSEKIINPMLAGAIPIYLGAPDIGEHFNTKSFINVSDFESFEKCIEYVLKVDSDPVEYQKILSEPWFNKNSYIDLCYSKGSEYHQNNVKIISKISKNLPRYNLLYDYSINMVTFSDGEIYSYKRILEEGIKSRYFDKIFCFNKNNLDSNFLEKHQNFIQENKRGFGYYIWKPKVILQALNNIGDGDCLFYSDSGNTILSGSGAILNRYLSQLEKTGPKSMLLFKINFLSKNWTKRETVTYLENKYNTKFDLDDYMFTACLLVLRKNEFTLKFIQEWLEIMENYELINDDFNPDQDPEFREHRYDQSILDLMARYYNIPFETTNFDDDKNFFTTPEGEMRMFSQTRLK